MDNYGLDNKSEDFDIKSLEDEYNLRKIAKYQKEKMFSQDINIGYPGIQEIKEKFRELNFNYKSLSVAIKKLLSNIQINQKNGELAVELRKIVKLDSKGTNKILSNNF